MSRVNVSRLHVTNSFHHSIADYYWTVDRNESNDTKFVHVDVSDNIGASNRSGGNTSTSASERGIGVWQALKIAIFVLIITGTVVGNLLVCAAIYLTRKLRTASNLLIMSLAVSDLFVGTVDMPFAAVYDVTEEWLLGRTVCDLWTSVDVLVCSASILNLCMICVDRYMTVTKPFVYASPVQRSPARTFLMIGAVWVLSTAISVPPLLGWKRPDPVPGECEVSQDKGYQFFATVCSFYLPLCVMVVLYARLYRVSSRLAKTVHGQGVRNDDRRGSSSLTPNGESTASAFQQNHATVQGLINDGDKNDVSNPGRSGDPMPCIISLPFVSPLSSPLPVPRFQSRGHSIADALIRINCRLRLGAGDIGVRLRASDRKATRTLGAIMGAFVVCWLPFFVLAVTRPLVDYPSSAWTRWLDGLVLWLGYANSLLNPVIYARLNREFRVPFECILRCRCADIDARLRSENFAEQFGRVQFYRPGPSTVTAA